MWLLVPDGMVSEFQKLLVFCDFSQTTTTKNGSLLWVKKPLCCLRSEKDGQTVSSWWKGNIYLNNHMLDHDSDLNTTAHKSIVAYHDHPFMTTVYPSSEGCFQQDNTPYYTAHVNSNRFHCTQMTSTVTFGMWWNWRFSSWMINCVLLSCQYGLKSPMQCSQLLVESGSWKIKAAKVGPTQYLQGVTNVVSGECTVCSVVNEWQDQKMLHLIIVP